jgi:CopG family nickel-responsive transcriptional regulator
MQRRLSDLQFDNIAEVISPLHAHLTEDKMMEVHLVQGPAPKGVITARLQ